MLKITSHYTTIFHNIAILFIACLSIFIFSACKEDKGNIGLGVQPEDELLNTDYLETPVSARSTLHDSLITSTVSVNMFGYLNDPVFGKTQAGIYTQFRLSDHSVNFGDSVTVDSLVLTLVYAGYYGDTLNSLRVNVYELTGNLDKDKDYYAKSSLSHSSNSLTENPNLYISPTPSTKQDSSTSSYYLRIKLDKNFAVQKFVSQSGGNVYANDANFLEHFKGLFLEATGLTGNGCLVSLNMTHTLSRLTMYYNNSQEKGLKYYFNMNDSTVHFGTINHFDYADAEQNLRGQLNGDTTSTKEILYGQAGSGIKVVLNFPQLKETFKDKKVVIHRASLVVSHKNDALNNYPNPSSMNLTYTDPASGIGYLLSDYYLGLQYQNDYFGGKYNQINKEYVFNITQYIQELVDERGDDYPLNLSVIPSITHFSRLMIYGTHPNLADDFNKRLRLKINYTIINK